MNIINEENSILTTKEYGKINICLKELLDKKGLSRYYLAKKVDTHFQVIDKWCKDKVERLDLDLLARVCYVLECEPADIIKYDKYYTDALIEAEAKVEDEN